jgi:hypothetical protein
LYWGNGQASKLFKINLFVAVLVFHNVQCLFFAKDLIWIWEYGIAVQTRFIYRFLFSAAMLSLQIIPLTLL